MSRISCIVVSYNKGKFLKDAIISVLNQTVPVDEIIVADDGSTDGSRNLITSLAQEYRQIKPIFREKNLGVAANRDLAIREAKGELLTTLDGDDWYSPQKIEKELIAIQNKPSAIAYSDVRLVNQEGKLIDDWDISRFSKFDTVQRLHWLSHRLGPIPRDMLLPKKLYLEVLGMRHDIPIYEDWDFKIRLAACPNQWIHSGIAGINYRKTKSGLSQSNLLIHTKCQYQVLMLNQKLLKNYIGAKGFWLAIAKVILKGGRSVARKIILPEKVDRTIKSTKKS
jgi:glycosyltransferase involved in cell wall biosynthesis